MTGFMLGMAVGCAVLSAALFLLVAVLIRRVKK